MVRALTRALARPPTTGDTRRLRLTFGSGLMGVPLFLVGLGLRSERPEVARRTAIASAVLLVAVAFVLVMQLLDPNEILSDRLVQVAGLSLYGAALLTELPALAHRGPDGAGARSRRVPHLICPPWGWDTVHR